MKNSICLKILPVLSVLLLVNGCAQKSKPPEDCVARVGDRVITSRHLKQSFELNPKWGKGLTYREAYGNQLDYLISEKMFALDAHQQGMADDSILAGYLDFVGRKEMIKALYHEEVASKVEVSKDELENAYVRLKKQVRFAYIHTRDADRADHYAELLQRVDPDSIDLAESGEDVKGKTELLGFGEMHPEIEQFIFDMDPGEVHDPVWIDNGYMVIKLIDGEIDRFMSERDFAENRSKLEKVIIERKAAVVANGYIKDIMKDANVQLNPDVFFPVAELFFNHIRENSEGNGSIPVFLSDEEIGMIETDPSLYQNEVIVTFRDGQMTVGEILQQLADMPAGLRPRVKMAGELRDAIGVIVRNRFLARRAEELNLDRLPEVKEAIREQRDTILAEYWLSNQKGLIAITDEEIADFRQSSSFEEAAKRYGVEPSRDQIVDFITEYKMALVKLDATDRLKSTFPVAIDSALFKSSIPNQEQVIERDPIPFVTRELFF